MNQYQIFDFLADMAILNLWKKRGLPITPSIINYLERKYQNNPLLTTIITSQQDEEIKKAQLKMFGTLMPTLRQHSLLRRITSIINRLKRLV